MEYIIFSGKMVPSKIKIWRQDYEYYFFLILLFFCDKLTEVNVDTDQYIRVVWNYILIYNDAIRNKQYCEILVYNCVSRVQRG
jgi:hypothetical protein